MPATKTDVCNGALQKIGAARIGSLLEDSKEAKICAAEYDKTRRFILRLYPWGFAIGRSVLTPDPVAPAFEFEYRHQLPADFLRLVELYEYDGKYRVEQGFVLADSDTLNLKYVKDLEDLTYADSLFIESFEWYLAYNISRHLTESESVRQEAMQGFKGAIPFAKFVQSTEQSQQELEAFDLIDARLGTSRFVRDPMT